MRWAFWRGPAADSSTEPVRALPDDVGLPTRPRPPAASAHDDGQDDAEHTAPAGSGPSGAPPTTGPSPTYDAPLSAPAPDLDRSALAAAGQDVARHVRAAHAGTPVEASGSDARVLAGAATGALAARLPVLSGVEGAAAFDEPADELLHAYADLLVSRAAVRRTTVDRDDLLAVAHLAAAAAAVDAAADPVLLLLAGVPAEVQLAAAALLLAQTADDGGGAPDRLAVEVRELFARQG